MTGLLTFKSDIEKLQQEYKLYASHNFSPQFISKNKTETAVLVLEECEL